MDYFELYEIPLSLKIDKNLIQKKYYALCKLFHPDRFTLTNENEQGKAEDMIAIVNTAKSTLEQEDLRLAYVLKQKNIIIEEEKYALSPAFLGEMMDINEQLMELEFDKNDKALEELKLEIQEKIDTAKSKVEDLFNSEVLELSETEAHLLKEYYYQKKYLNRLIEKTT